MFAEADLRSLHIEDKHYLKEDWKLSSIIKTNSIPDVAGILDKPPVFSKISK